MNGDNVEEFLKAIPGAFDLFDWFGHWPGFHDAEIVSLVLDRSGVSTLKVNTWQMTKQVDGRGCFILEKPVTVSFAMEEILDLELNGFSCQNVIFGLELNPIETGYRIELSPCYGLAGWINAKGVFIRIEPFISLSGEHS